MFHAGEILCIYFFKGLNVYAGNTAKTFPSIISVENSSAYLSTKTIASCGAYLAIVL